MAKKGVVAQLTRQERLRRVVLLSCACLRNIAYYRAGWDKKTAVFIGELQATVNSNFVDMAVLDWCKLFGETKELHHWGLVLNDVQKRRSFKKGVLDELKCTSAEWNVFHAGMLEYRHEFLAHLDSTRKMKIPVLDLAVGATSYYHAFLITHENDGRTYGTLPVRPAEYYRHCFDDGLRFYGRA